VAGRTAILPRGLALALVDGIVLGEHCIWRTEMTKERAATGSRSVQIARDAIGNNIITGDRNKARLHYQQVTLPPPNTVNIHEELSKLRESLVGLKSEDATKIHNALNDAESELKKPSPDKGEVGGAIERVLEYAKQAVGYAELAEKLKPQVINVAAWLGTNWHSLLAYVGLST
jgi:hypothetical protein